MGIEMYNNILVAFDGSEASERALGYAHELVEHRLADRLVILNVTDPSDLDDATLEIAARMANVTINTSTEEIENEVIRKISIITELYTERIDIVSRTGKPQKIIIDVAEEYECGLIVMGSRGLGAIRGALGSVSHAVLRDAEVPVFITK